jgi:hypothetical protein
MHMRRLTLLWALISLPLNAQAEDTPLIIDLATDTAVAIAQPETHLHHHQGKRLKNAPQTDNAVNPDFPATRYPFTPKLLVSQNQKLCVPFFESARKYFFAGQKRKEKEDAIYGWGALPSGTFDIEGGRWLGGQPEVIRVPAKNGQKPYTVLITHQLGIHGSFNTTLYVKPEEIKQEEIEKIFDGKYIDSSEMEKNGWKIAAGAVTYGEVPLHLLWINNTLYLYKNGLEDAGQDTAFSPNEASLYSIEPATGDLDETCTVLAAPETETLGPPRFHRYKETKTDPNETKELPDIETPSALKEFFDVTEEVVGMSLNSQPCQGTEGPYEWSRYYTTRNAMRYEALARPWDLAIDTEQVDLADFVNKWATNNLYNYRIYQKIIGQMPDATKALADFYHDTYGLKEPEANSFAEKAMGIIMKASFVTHWSDDPEIKASLATKGDEKAFRQRYKDALASENLSPLLIRKAVLFGMMDLVQETPKEQLAKHDDDLVRKHYDGPDYLPEPLIFYALDDEKMLTLLINKAEDINGRNWFGKTPLMYAAQWNMPETVNLLLADHADINAATQPMPKDDMWNCSGRPTISGRTALMYAAENASTPIIQNLLQAGANREAKDSKGRSAKDYLANNQLLNDNERKELSAAFTQ